MSIPDTTYISYAGHHLAIDISVPGLQEDVTRIFKQLLVDNPPSVFHRLTIQEKDEGFYIDGANEMDSYADSLRTVLQHLKFEVIHQFINLTTNQLWLHAAAASLQGRGILLTGGWGKGKSTIVSELCHIGALYLSDDIVPIDMQTGLLMPFHLTPMRREFEHADAHLSPLEISNLPKRIITLTPEDYASEGVTLSAIIFPEYTPDAQTSLETFSPAQATMTLLENCLNLKTKKGEAVHYIGRMIERVPVYKLPYNDGARGAELIAESITE